MKSKNLVNLKIVVENEEAVVEATKVRNGEMITPYEMSVFFKKLQINCTSEDEIVKVLSDNYNLKECISLYNMIMTLKEQIHE